MWNREHGVVVSKWTFCYSTWLKWLSQRAASSRWKEELSYPDVNLPNFRNTMSLCGKVKLSCSVHHVLFVALYKSLFNWCTELASGSPLRIPVFLEHYTWIIPLDAPEARFWALFPEDEKKNLLNLIWINKIAVQNIFTKKLTHNWIWNRISIKLFIHEAYSNL